MWKGIYKVHSVLLWPAEVHGLFAQSFWPDSSAEQNEMCSQLCHRIMYRLCEDYITEPILWAFQSSNLQGCRVFVTSKYFQALVFVRGLGFWKNWCHATRHISYWCSCTPRRKQSELFITSQRHQTLRQILKDVLFTLDVQMTLFFSPNWQVI